MLNQILSRLIVDPCVRAGRVPAVGGPFGNWFRKRASSRIIRVGSDHPLAELLAHEEWKTSFSISDHTLLWLWNYVNAVKPRSILELGSGLSTLVFAKYVSECVGVKPRFVSVDHDESWLDQTRRRAEVLGLSGQGRLELSAIDELGLAAPFASQRGYRLDIPSLSDYLGSPDLILIDGPPSAVGREGTFPSILPMLTKRATVLLDDAYRDKESNALRSWVLSCEGRLCHDGTYPLGSGLGRMTFLPEQ